MRKQNKISKGMDKARIIFKELFYTLTGALILFVILETAWPGVVLAYFNINWLLIFWLIAGILILLFDKKYLPR
ncbi:hypothetical protein CO116_00360 [Candidatus Falkowbacteria bacterium CG_4_9_14_3_um_filter_38_19]|uniref:Uncharacterized protein n=2 Tax=Candidatus Falkowiibacteriota TaxID=1752728 RepID=A0A2M6WRQ2_9BACT|nr:hypothetical protein [Candidatus Falkowbacteria bacterium]PIT95454.1 MAG: hypothetical protein COT96_01165 [Candidatus Falkowbacteria bacterium CG10_big_fil_rev_8_21_14_0_10_38_22]PJB17956.1 MAG: hypothetical protein CO116_00360 [Candidatus Falkowbacteria bacterium CG_4_9_14_3_um_filter_38_19]